MFSNDPFQSQLSLGGYPGAINPFTSPYTSSMQGGLMQPQTGFPFGQHGYGGIQNYGGIAPQQLLQEHIRQLQQIQQLQTLASILSQQSNPWQMQQPGAFQNPLQNPLIAATLQHNPLLAQQLAQQQNPFAQTGYPLAPQSWVGPHYQTGRGIY